MAASHLGRGLLSNIALKERFTLNANICFNLILAIDVSRNSFVLVCFIISHEFLSLLRTLFISVTISSMLCTDLELTMSVCLVGTVHILSPNIPFLVYVVQHIHLDTHIALSIAFKPSHFCVHDLILAACCS